MCNSGELIVADLKKYADFAAEVDIGINDAFNAIEAADGDLFADLCNCAVDNVADGLALVFGEGLSHHIFNGSGILLCNMLCKGSNKVFEIVGLCNKVGFAVDFDDTPTPHFSQTKQSTIPSAAMREAFFADAARLFSRR